MSLAPIVLFVYNRPEHTQIVLEALSLNDLASESILYIYSDAPKSDDLSLVDQVNKTRTVIRSRKWCGKVEIIESEINRGLAQSIVAGVTEVINRHGRVIVLEDDIVPSSGFLRFMNSALDKYELQESVMHISGYMYPVSNKIENGTVFLRVLSCWGWATWWRAWATYTDELEIFIKKLDSEKERRQFNIRGNAPFYNQLILNYQGSLKTWAVRWFASWYFRGGLALFPKTSLIKNIGHDGSGVHSGKNKHYDSEIIASEIDLDNPPLEVNGKYSRKIDEFYKRENEIFSKRRGLSLRIKMRIKGIVKIFRRD